MKKVWVLTYTIGTNEGRKQRRLTCDTKEQAIMQQGVLGGEVVEYMESPRAFEASLPKSFSVDQILEEIRKVQNDPKSYGELYQCRFEPEEDRTAHNEAVIELVVDEVSSLIDDMSNHSPLGMWENPGSAEWDCAKVEALNTLRKILDDLR